MTLVLTLIALWLIPGIITYCFASWHSHDWRFTEKDIVLLLPIVNIVMLTMLLLMTAEYLISEVIDWFTKE